MTRLPIATDQIYHIYNRGVDRRKIFNTDDDRVRFMQYLFHLNKTSINENLARKLSGQTTSHMKEVGPPSLLSQTTSDKLVNIFSFALMPNHYHLMLQQNVEGGISSFMQKLGTGYTMFFNEKYSRTGVLFQGKYKYKALRTDTHFLYLPHYIHLNPLAVSPDEGGPTSFMELCKYKWSSLPNYVGGQSFPSVIDTKLILDTFDGIKKYREDFTSTYNDLSHVDEIEDIALDWSE